MSTHLERLMEKEQTLFWLISRDDITDWIPRPFQIGKTEDEIVDLYTSTQVSKEDIEKHYIILGEMEAPIRMAGTYLIEYEAEEMAAHLVHTEGDIFWLLPNGEKLNYFKFLDIIEVTETISVVNPETEKGEILCFS